MRESRVTDGPGNGSDNIWDRLRRRKVVQWGIAYAAGSWGFLQGLSYLSTVFAWSAQLQRYATVAFLVGLPIALVLAWYHGDRGHQRVSGREFAILTVLLLLGGGLFWWVGRLPPAPVAIAAGPGAAQAQAPAGPSIAVLPFVNMSGDKENEYFSDGISEELLNVLVRVDGLGVASRTSSFGYKGSQLGTADIAKALKVNHVLEGSVRKSGNHVRITAQLIDAVNDRHLWSESYDRELTDIFAIQAEIANSIVTALRGQLEPAKAAATVSVRADTENVEAYQLYLKARELFIARSDLKESVRLFEQVTQLDPSFARGWEGLAAAAAVMMSWGFDDRDYNALTESAAERALELDATLSMPWAALSFAQRSRLPVDYAKVLDLNNRAIAADPRNATAYLWRSIAWTHVGEFDRALADQASCLAIDPAYQNCIRWNGLTLLFMGETERALARFQTGIDADFIFNRAESFVAALLKTNQPVAARMLLRELGVERDLRKAVLDVAARKGQRHPEADKLVARYIAEGRSKQAKQLQLAGSVQIRIWLGDYDGLAAAPDLDGYTVVMWDPNAPGLRNSAGFKRVIERLGVLAYWRTKGFPPQCRAAGEQDFTCD